MSRGTLKSLPSLEEITETFPLHVFVWNNDHIGLKESLVNNQNFQEEIDKLDVRGRTPLMLAVVLNHYESAEVLLEGGADVNMLCDGWSTVQEATVTQNPKLIKLILEWRSYRRKRSQFGGMPELLSKLKDSPDFYIEMKWEFTSWMPLISRFCPSDTCKIYKQGSKVRVDSSLMNFDTISKWQRRNMTMIYAAEDNRATIMEINHDIGRVLIDERSFEAPQDITMVKDVTKRIQERVCAPIFSSNINIDKISFERSKCGVWGWRQDKTESVNGYECKVLSANNVELVTRMRTEHLSERDREQWLKEENNRMDSVFGFECSQIIDSEEPVSIREYFAPDYDLGDRTVGKGKIANVKKRKFKATLWLCENFPLSLQEQIMPIVNLLAASNGHFRKLKDFIEMQMPAGFPVKVEIPLFHVFNACVTFGNVFASERTVEGVCKIEGDDCKLMCDIDETLFGIPEGYTIIADAKGKRSGNLDGDDGEYMQFALQNQLYRDSGYDTDKMDVWEALQARHPYDSIMEENDPDLQKAIAASLMLNGDMVELQSYADADGAAACSTEDADLMEALEISKREQEAKEREKRLEEELLQRALELSLAEK